MLVFSNCDALRHELMRAHYSLLLRIENEDFRGGGVMVKDVIPNNYAVLLNDIKQRIRSAQYEALKAVNKELISLYWDIGQMIIER